MLRPAVLALHSMVLLAFALVGQAADPSPGADAATIDGGQRIVLRIYYDEIEQIRSLVDYDVWEFNNTAEKFVLAAVPPDAQDDLRAMGFDIELDPERTEEFTRARTALPDQTTGIPGFPCYRTVEEGYATALALVAQHPDLASWIDVGDSWEKSQGIGGYDLQVLRLTNSAIPGPKPKLFITSSIHAREYTPAELSTRFAEYLVQNYGVDADATWLLDYQEIHLMLQANPDGRKKAETGLSWRKNTDENYCAPTSNLRGADLNRNFEFEWACCNGSSSSECSETYRGPSASSEPETAAIQAYMQELFPDQRLDGLSTPAPDDATGVYLDIHSFSRLVLWPWGFGSDSGNDTQFQTLGRKLAFFNGYTPQQAVDLYPTDGTTIDFAYGDLGVAAFVYELGTSFFQSCSQFENVILPDNLSSLVYAAKVARRPYEIPAGPDALGVSASPATAESGASVTLSATIDDTRFNNGNGAEPVQTIVAAEYSIDTPPWITTSGVIALPMTALDGVFDSQVESVSATVDTTGLVDGRHTLFVRGQDAAGNWGAVSATFFYTVNGPVGRVIGTLIEADSGLPLGGSVSVDAIGVSTITDPVSGGFTLTLPVGEWGVRASAPGHFGASLENTPIVADETVTRNFALAPSPRTLLVDDDDDSPDVLESYTAALDAIGESYQLWDTGSGENEPRTADLEPFESVIWFTGDRSGASTGPGAAAELALGQWLDPGNCLWVSSQDYLSDRGLTPLLATLGVLDGVADSGHPNLVGIGSVFGALGPFDLAYPYIDRGDALMADSGTKIGFTGAQGDAAVTRDTGAMRSTMLGFGLEAIPTAEGRHDALQSFLSWCSALDGADPDLDGSPNLNDCAPLDPDLWARPSAASGLTVTRAATGNLTWDAAQPAGSATLSYDLLRAEIPAALQGASCVESGLSGTSATDAEEPAPGGLFVYFVRAHNGCGANQGSASAGPRQSVASCPE